MTKRKNKKIKKIKKIKLSKKTKEKIKYYLILMGLTSMLLIISTYSWFITLNTVSLETFQVVVKSLEGMEISLNGKDFSDEVTLSKDDLETYFLGNTNKWPTEGLEPVSTAGEIDKNTGRLKFYSKIALLSSRSGYRLTAKRINEDKEQGNYLVFDFFIKNSTNGSGYKESLDFTTEDIVLNNKSYVRIETDEEARSRTENGQEVPTGGDGIENGIRVAFYEIGRVYKKASTNAIIGIKCKDEVIDNYQTTALCGYDGDELITHNIWEPNDTKHNYKAKNLFDVACEKRTGVDTFSGKCDTWEANGHVDTYAVNDTISSKDYINIYDGLNGYTDLKGKLVKTKYYSDSVDMNDYETIFHLAVNSITKIRVYVYLEGQDVDTLDYDKLQKKIKLNMIFSKGDVFEG